MGTVLKIKIRDNMALRTELDAIYENASQSQIAQWALELAEHVLEQFAPCFLQNEIVQQGFFVNRNWQKGLSRTHDVRQAGFEIHRLAKVQNDEMTKTALRVVGQAVATGHMKEHGMVASDYAIKCINLAFPDDTIAVEKERNWQISELKHV